MRTLVLAVACLVALCAAQTPGQYTGTVYCQGGVYKFVAGVQDKTAGAAYALFDDGEYAIANNGTGWGVLYLSTNPQGAPDDPSLMYAAGYLEASLTWRLIYDLYMNYNFIWFGNDTAPVPSNVTQFINEHVAYVRQSISNNSLSDPYWAEVQLIFRQFDGLVDGYNAAAAVADSSKVLSATQLYMLNANGDMSDVLAALNLSSPTNGTNSSTTATAHSVLERLKSRITRGNSGRIFEQMRSMQQASPNAPNSTLPAIKTSHCSSLVRVAPGNSDIFFAHDTWASFGEMVRIYKHYNLALNRDNNRRVSFSSSAGFLSSVDDWYISSKGLTISETTNEFYNTSMYSQILAGGNVFSWVRAMVATYTASTGPAWVSTFVRQNSGTYNNQWIILDNKLFSPNMASLPDGLLTIVEVLPGLYETADVTSYLRTQGYWASYNVPFFPYIYNVSGFFQQFQQQGNQYSWSLCARAQIFARDAPKVATFDEFKLLMTSNNWQRDPLSLNSPSNAIMARGDLDPVSPAPFGGIDSKCTTWSRALQLSCDAMNGPTHQSQAPFSWAPFASTPHHGQPDLFNFAFVPMSPDQLLVAL